MTSHERKRPAARSWPEWLEPLRPDDLSHARMKREILRRAQPILREMGEPPWRTITSGWSRIGTPMAVAVVVLFLWLAYQAGPATPLASDSLAPEPSPPEALLVAPGSDGPPAVLTAGTAPDRDRVLEAALQGGR